MLTINSTLVEKEAPNGFHAFLQENGIHHRVMVIEATKKQDIEDSIMVSLMEVIMNPMNHPILIHCNQGKVSISSALMAMV